MFKEIPRFIQKYSISTEGEVINLKTHKILKHQIAVRGGHHYVRLAGKTEFIHVLMLETFKGSRPEGARGIHSDDNPDNNQISNLEWGPYRRSLRNKAQIQTAKQKERSDRLIRIEKRKYDEAEAERKQATEEARQLILKERKDKADKLKELERKRNEKILQSSKDDFHNLFEKISRSRSK